MTGNRVPDPSAQAGEDQDKPLAMPSKPPPPPVRRKSGASPPSPPAPVLRTASPPPAPSRVVTSQPPPPPKRSKPVPPSPSVAPARALAGLGRSQPPPPPSSRKQQAAPSPPPLPLQAAPELAPGSFAAVPAVMGLPPWEVAQAPAVGSEIEQPEARALPSLVVESNAPPGSLAKAALIAPAAVEEPPTGSLIAQPRSVEEPATDSVPTQPLPVVEPVARLEVAAGEAAAHSPTVEEPTAGLEAAASETAAHSPTVEEPAAGLEAAASETAAPSPTAEDRAPLDEALASPEQLAAEAPTSPTAAPALAAAASAADESKQTQTEAPRSEELDSNSDNEPTHVVDATMFRARLAHDEPAHDEPAHDESSASHEAEPESQLASPQEPRESVPLAVEQALALEHALDAESAPAPEAPPDPEAAQPVKAERDFSSIGSEMPVVLSTPAPPPVAGAAAASPKVGPIWLPAGKAWSKKLGASPRTLVLSAPIVALLGIWIAHQFAMRSPHDAPAPNAVVEAVPASEPITAAPEASAVLASPPLAASATESSAESSSAAEPAPPPSPSVDPAELKAAQTHGLAALEALAAKYPGDVQVGIALASQQARAQRFDAAVSTLDVVLAASPSSAQNGKVMGILWRAAQSSASERTFASLRKLGARGSDVAFDLAVTPGVRETVRESARVELADHLAEAASADTRVAAALLLAPDCSARQALLERAEREGGKRTRGLLERYARGSGCATNADTGCSACLAGSPELSRTLAKLAVGAQP